MKQQTLQEQYNLIKRGKGHKDKFMSDAKRQFPKVIRNAATLSETISSLKHNHIISDPTILTEGKEIDFFKSFKSRMLKESFDVHSQVYPSMIEDNIERIKDMLLDGYAPEDVVDLILNGDDQYLDEIFKISDALYNEEKISNDMDAPYHDDNWDDGDFDPSGGHGPTSHLEEIDTNDPVLMKARAAAFQRTQPQPEIPKPVKTINPDYKAVKNADKIKALKLKRAQLMRDMEQEAEPEGGEVADEYGDLLNKIDQELANLRGESEWGPETNPYMGKDKIDRIASTLEGRHEPKFRGQVRESKGSLNENKAVESKPTKEIVDMETKAYDYKDLKNINNLYGEEFLKGFQLEMEDPKNETKNVEQLKAIVVKNLTSDRLYYVKNSAFGIRGIGYTDQTPGLKASKSDQMEKVKLKEGKISLKEIDDEKDDFFEDDVTNDKILSMLRKSIDDDSTIKDQRSKERKNANVFVRENGEGGTLEQAKSEAQRISKEEGVSQHVNKIGNIYKVEDWYDSDTTVASYENGRSLRESNLKGSVVTEASSKGTGSLTIEKRKDGKYYWQYKFKSGKKEDWPEGFNTKADAQKDFMYRSKYIIRENEYEGMDYEDELANREFGMDFDQLGPNEQQWVRDEMGESREYTQDDFENSHNTDGHPEDTEMPSWMKENKNKKIIKLTDILKEGLPLGEKEKPKKVKPKKETTDSKLSEIDKQGRIVTLEAQIETLDQIIDSKNQRISLVSEDESLSELVDKKKIKEMQKEIKFLEKKKAGIQKMYEKLSGTAYVKQEIVDEDQDQELEEED
jgi:hypothetical protein